MERKCRNQNKKGVLGWACATEFKLAFLRPKKGHWDPYVKEALW